MRDSVREGLRFGILFGLFIGFISVVAHGIIGAILIGAVAGCFLGGLVAWMHRRKARGWAKQREPYEPEGVLHDGPAACAIGPGHLVLTKQRLIWLPTSAHDREKRIEIERGAITKVGPGRGIGAQIRIEVHTGESVQFVVRDPKTWLKQLNLMVKLLA